MTSTAALLAASSGLLAPSLAAALTGLMRRQDPDVPGVLPPVWLVLLGLSTALLVLPLVAGPAVGVGQVVGAGWVVVLATLAAVDVRTRCLPDALLAPAAGAALVVAETFGQPTFGGALLGGGIGLGVVGLLAGLGRLVWRHSVLGFGDVKFAGLLGLLVGPVSVLLALDGFVITAGAALLVRRGLGWARPGGTLPLGPFLAAGGYLALLLRG